MGFLLTACRFAFNFVVMVTIKTIGFLWKMLNLLPFFDDHHRVHHHQVHQRRFRSYMNLVRYEQDSRFIGSISFTRYETLEETYIYGKCHNDHWDEMCRVLLYEKNKVGARTQCYIYSDDSENDDVKGIQVPAPVTVTFLETLLDQSVE